MFRYAVTDLTLCISSGLLAISVWVHSKANSADRDQTPQNMMSDQGHHYLLL